MNILVTGATGAIGVNVVRFLLEQNRDVVAHGRSPLPVEKNVLADFMGQFKLELGNVVDLSHILHVIKSNKVEGIMHFATMQSDAANQHPMEALQVNIIGCANMLEAARLMGLKRIIVASSSAVMGAPADLLTPRKEEEIVLPASGIYALSKLTCEQLVYTYRQLYGVDAIAVRPRAVYGPGEPHYRPGQPIWDLVRDAVAGKPIRKATGGDTTVDHSYVKDIARGVIQAYDCKTPKYHVYNLSRGKLTKVSEVCEVLKKLFPDLPIDVGPGIWPGFLAKGEQEDLTYRGSMRPPQDISKARQDFGYEPEWDIERAIPDWVRWLTQGKYW